MELNYHIGVTMHKADNVKHIKVIHGGVQYMEGKEDIILAGLLFCALKDESTLLSKVLFDVNLLKKELMEIVEEEKTTITHKSATKAFCQTVTQKVKLLCICNSPWIEGTTAKAIYGSKIKDFDVHSCCNCGGWFHKYCLRACNIRVPKRTEDFLCPLCKTPNTIPWSHPVYTNTCTSDNFMTILLVHAQTNSNFLSCLGSSESELVLKASITAMLKLDMINGKRMMLDYFHSKIGLPKRGNLLDCFGTEFALCLSFFSHIWKLHVTLSCNSPHCPDGHTERYPSSFVLENPVQKSFTEQLEDQFPRVSDNYGAYCGADFKGQNPPKGSKYSLNARTDLETGLSATFYECRGQLTVTNVRFISKSPWLLPLRIDSLTQDSIMNLPTDIKVFHREYVLLGWTMHSPGHYTAGVIWRGKRYSYDGLDKQGLVPLKTEHLKDGSYAYYILKC